MREILFRGKTLCEDDYDRSLYKDDVWMYGDLDIEPEHRIAFIKCDDEDDKLLRRILKVRFDTVGQYTGFNDKNENKVFEGDIVKTKYGRLCVVKYITLPSYAGYDFDAIESKNKCPDGYDVFRPYNLEVVGNVHDNPELVSDSHEQTQT